VILERSCSVTASPRNSDAVFSNSITMLSTARGPSPFMMPSSACRKCFSIVLCAESPMYS